MKVIEDFPPNYQDILAALGDVSKAKPVFCYGDTIYNPFRRKITIDVEHHEEVHARQQGDDPALWYVKYLMDRSFRLSQEIEAYGAQYHFAKSKGVKGKLLSWLQDNLAWNLSGEAYGKLITYGEAVSKIRNYKPNVI